MYLGQEHAKRRVLTVAFLITASLMMLRRATPKETGTPDSTVRLVRMIRLVIPLPARSNARKVRVLTDPFDQKVHLRLPGISSRAVAGLKMQLAAAGGSLLKIGRKKGEVHLVLFVPFDNLQAYATVGRKPKRIRLDVGTGRYLPPHAPRAPYSRRLSADAGPEGILACVCRADLQASLQMTEEAGDTSRLCLRRAKATDSPLLPLAALKVIAYGGDLMKIDPEDLEYKLKIAAGDRATHEWLEQELLFEKGRIYMARGEFGRALQSFVGLFEQHPESADLQAAVPLAVAAAHNHADRMTRRGLYATLSADLLRMIETLAPIDAKIGARLTPLTARALLGAGLPGLAVDLLLWRMKQRQKEKLPSEIFLLLAESLLAAGDTYRAGKTLDYLEAIKDPGTARPTLEILRGRVAEATDKPDLAISHFIAAAKASRDPAFILQASWRGAVLLRKKGQLRRALQLVSRALARPGILRLKGDLVSNLLMLQADLAYESGDVRRARTAYRRLLTRYPDDPRASAVRYRLKKLGQAGILPAGQEPAGSTPDCWTEARRALNPSAKNGGKNHER